MVLAINSFMPNCIVLAESIASDFGGMLSLRFAWEIVIMLMKTLTETGSSDAKNQ